MRNLASAKELSKIADIEKFVNQSVNLGFIKNETDLVNSIVKFNI